VRINDDIAQWQDGSLTFGIGFHFLSGSTLGEIYRSLDQSMTDASLVEAE
jgi:hypothetical protein